MNYAGLLTALLLAGCATEYQAKGPDGGYADTRLGPALWRVDITANDYTRPDLVREFALLRSAELAVQHGYPYFAVADPESGTASPRFTEPSAGNLVFMFAGRPAVAGPVFDAQEICTRLGDIYNVSCHPAKAE